MSNLCSILRERSSYLFYTIIMLLFICSSNVFATITTLQSIDFGTIAVTDNSQVSSLLIDPAGNVQVIGGIAVIDNGNQGIFELSGFPSNSTITADVTVLNSQMISQVASEETFTFSLIVFGNSLVTDQNGTAQLSVGGRIDTSGNGIDNFTDTDYESTIQVTVSF
ncbi:MAG: DUF4402 domain-containing protein [Pseudomonadota bacterium]